MKKTFLASSVAAGLVSLLAGCVAQTNHTPTPVVEGKILSESEYEYRIVTGSNIPVRVPKSPTARPVPTIAPVTVMNPEQFGDMLRRGQR